MKWIVLALIVYGLFLWFRFAYREQALKPAIAGACIAIAFAAYIAASLYMRYFRT